MTGETLILLKMIFFKHICSKYEKGEKKPMKSMPSDHLVRLTPEMCSFFNSRLSVSCEYDTVFMQNNSDLCSAI